MFFKVFFLSFVFVVGILGGYTLCLLFLQSVFFFLSPKERRKMRGGDSDGGREEWKKMNK